MTQSNKIIIIAIESSCDDTAASVVADGNILANCIAGQAVHEQYGGVVPELASRAHQQHIIPVVQAAMKAAGKSLSDLDAVAFTRGPGLIGSLLVGSSFAKGLALGLKLPLIEVNHMQAHVLAHMIDEPRPAFPFLCLTVSGGHTQIVLVRDYLDMEVIGKTTDDAAGEAFDKSAKILGLPYPGGPLVDKYAKEGNPGAFKFPLPNVPGLDYSFSGLKTSFLYFIQQNTRKDKDFMEKHLADICASIQQAIVEALMQKLEKAAVETGISRIAISGGVSANSGLRRALEEKGKELGWETFIPRFEYCTDNAAMIAIAAHYKFLKGEFAAQDAVPYARGEI
jgi:N6-L-threonylcarbamoyladenine synthase